MRPDNNRHFYPAHRLYVTLDAVINGSRFLQADALPVTKQTNSVKSLKESVKELTPATEQKRLESPFHDPINYRRNVCKAGVCSRSHTKKVRTRHSCCKVPQWTYKVPEQTSTNTTSARPTGRYSRYNDTARLYQHAPCNRCLYRQLIIPVVYIHTCISICCWRTELNWTRYHASPAACIADVQLPARP